MVCVEVDGRPTRGGAVGASLTAISRRSLSLEQVVPAVFVLGAGLVSVAGRTEAQLGKESGADKEE